MNISKNESVSETKKMKKTKPFSSSDTKNNIIIPSVNSCYLQLQYAALAVLFLLGPQTGPLSDFCVKCLINPSKFIKNEMHQN